MRKIVALVPLIVFAGLIYFFWFGLGINPRVLPSSLLGKPVPHFSLATLGNTQPPLTEKDFKGHLSILHVWATWCATCKDEHPFFVELAPMDSIKIYGLIYKDDAENAKNFLGKNGNPYAKSGFDADGRVAIEWGVYGTPETYLIDQHGIVQYKHSGPLTRAVWENEMIPLIESLHRMDDPA